MAKVIKFTIYNNQEEYHKILKDNDIDYRTNNVHNVFWGLEFVIENLNKLNKGQREILKALEKNF